MRGSSPRPRRPIRAPTARSASSPAFPGSGSRLPAHRLQRRQRVRRLDRLPGPARAGGSVRPGGDQRVRAGRRPRGPGARRRPHLRAPAGPHPPADLGPQPDHLRRGPIPAAQLGDVDVNGIQSTGLLAQLKHFAFYNGQDQNTPSVVDERAAHELYLKPYEAAIARGGAELGDVLLREVPDRGRPGVAGVRVREHRSACRTCSRRSTGSRAGSGPTTAPRTPPRTSCAGSTRSSSATTSRPPRSSPLVDPASPTFDPAYARALDGAVARILYQYQRFGRLDDSSYPGTRRPTSSPAPRPDASTSRPASTWPAASPRRARSC